MPNYNNFKDLNELLEFHDPLKYMRKEFIDDLRKHVAEKKQQINNWVPRVLLNEK